MTEKLPEGWVFHRLKNDGSGYWEKRFGEHHRSPSASIWKCKDGFLGEYYRNVECVHSKGASTISVAMGQMDAVHKWFEAHQLRLRCEAAQLLDGDYAELMVGEEGAG